MAFRSTWWTLGGARHAALMAGLLSVCCAVQCAVTIRPVIVQVPADGRAIITVRNDRVHEVMYQLTVLRWHQRDGVDHYEPTQDFITSPPMFTLAPSVEQTVRMGLRRPEAGPLEQAYRLIVSEVPKSLEAHAEPGRVDMLMQYALPVFVAPSHSDAPLALVWRLREDAGALVVRADNPSARHVVLNAVGVTHAVGTAAKALSAPHVSPRRVTVLAQSWREWRFPEVRQVGAAPWNVWFVKEGESAAVMAPDEDTPQHVR